MVSTLQALPTGESGHNVQIAWNADNYYRNRSHNVVPCMSMSIHSLKKHEGILKPTLVMSVA